MIDLIDKYKRTDLGEIVLNCLDNDFLSDYENDSDNTTSKPTPVNTSCEDCGSTRAKERSFNLMKNKYNITIFEVA